MTNLHISTPTAKAISMVKRLGKIKTLLLVLSIFLTHQARALDFYPDWMVENEFLISDNYAYTAGQNDFLFVKPDYFSSTAQTNLSDIAKFYGNLKIKGTAYLPAPKWVPIYGDVTLFVPTYPLGKVVGDNFVQTLFVRSQVKRLLGKEIIDPIAFGTETDQFTKLYNNGLDFALANNLKFGTVLSQVATFNTVDRDMIWPELRKIRNEWVYVPILYLKADTISKYKVGGNKDDWTGSSITLGGINILAGGEMNLRKGFLQVAQDLTVTSQGSLNVSDNAKIVVQGSLVVDGGSIIAKQSTLSAADLANLYITAGDINIKSVVQVTPNRFGQTSSIGSIAKINSDGSMVLRSTGDINIAGAQIRANDNLTLGADGNITIGGVVTQNIFNGKENGWNTNRTTTEYLSSTISAQNTLQLIANGSIEIDGATISSDQGQLEILAGMGITVQDHQNYTELHRSGKFGKTKANEDAYKTVAIRALLEAGKGVVLNADYGDITLKAADIRSQTGTSVNASTGGVNMLVSKELDQYNYSSVKKSLLTIKSTNRGHIYEDVVANTIVGGIQIQAQNGLTVEYKGDASLSLDQQVAVLSKMPGLEWMGQVQVDHSSAKWLAINAKYEEWKKTQTSLSPAAAALISIAVAAATGGFSLSTDAVLNAALNAGITTLSTQAVLAITNGALNGDIGGALESLASEENLKALAISMVTAGALKKIDVAFFNETAIIDGKQVAAELSFTQQATQAVTHAAVSSGITVIAEGGNFDSFKESFVRALAQDAINELGKTLSTEIGAAARSGDITKATQYIAHAGLGCLTGSLTSSLNGSAVEESCLSGAGGGVIGEFVTQQELQSLQADTNAWVDKQLRGNTTLTDEQLEKQINRLIARGVDMGRLAAGLTAFVTNGDVNIAAAAAYNSGRFNAAGAVEVKEIAKKAKNGFWTWRDPITGLMKFSYAPPPGMGAFSASDNIRPRDPARLAYDQKKLRAEIDCSLNNNLNNACATLNKVWTTPEEKQIEDEDYAEGSAGQRELRAKLNEYKKVGGIVGDIVCTANVGCAVSIVYTNWNTMEGWEKAITIIPGMGIAAREAKFVANETKNSGKEFVSIYKAPQRGKGAEQFENGYDPSKFCDGDGCAYFAKERALAEKYAEHYGEGVIELKIPKEIYENRLRKYEYRYQNSNYTELPIPHEAFDVLNEAERIWRKASD